MKRKIMLVLMFCLIAIAGCQKQTNADVRIKVVMKRYSIDPAVIRVKSGEVVALEVATTDVPHGLNIPALGIRTPVQPGRTAKISFTAPAKGEYRIVCGILCGAHHEDMKGKLMVE